MEIVLTGHYWERVCHYDRETAGVRATLSLEICANCLKSEG